MSEILPIVKNSTLDAIHCPECNNSKLILDQHRGVITCSICGSVVFKRLYNL